MPELSRSKDDHYLPVQRSIEDPEKMFDRRTQVSKILSNAVEELKQFAAQQEWEEYLDEETRALSLKGEDIAEKIDALNHESLDNDEQIIKLEKQRALLKSSFKNFESSIPQKLEEAKGNGKTAKEFKTELNKQIKEFEDAYNKLNKQIVALASRNIKIKEQIGSLKKEFVQILADIDKRILKMDRRPSLLDKLWMNIKSLGKSLINAIKGWRKENKEPIVTYLAPLNPLVTERRERAPVATRQAKLGDRHLEKLRAESGSIGVLISAFNQEYKGKPLPPPILTGGGKNEAQFTFPSLREAQDFFEKQAKEGHEFQVSIPGGDVIMTAENEQFFIHTRGQALGVSGALAALRQDDPGVQRQLDEQSSTTFEPPTP